MQTADTKKKQRNDQITNKKHATINDIQTESTIKSVICA